jgi:hypothetical protein
MYSFQTGTMGAVTYQSFDLVGFCPTCAERLCRNRQCLAGWRAMTKVGIQMYPGFDNRQSVIFRLSSPSHQITSKDKVHAVVLDSSVPGIMLSALRMNDLMNFSKLADQSGRSNSLHSLR